ncbi:hypothetical protein BJ684DRAFT_21227 [Piptocephalis cylindrospora]|uniref:Transglutaminase-like domain-containing protein n=1 Tax=Piptocephalis cylindrospora TaxID=1907219 RepID=A0A4V1IXT9_9FUNG|nr:hypothetical protein BJ684DRAFT_21227 [Piptocephalis cylindrospora]|eukprot:RKP12219.1 hypothetical protein BJ684DRAFT_21227 [Piptocephalis cylindrospora]
METATTTLQARQCRRDGFAKLFHAMAGAAGLQCGLVRGYLKGPTDAVDGEVHPPINHTWNVVKIQGEYRFVDVGRAVPSHPYYPSTGGKARMDPFYFLAQPKHLIFTHYPSDPSQQYLSPRSMGPGEFHSLPYVTSAYFNNEIESINFHRTVLELREQDTAQLVFRVGEGISCYAEVDTIEHGCILTLSQCVRHEGHRISKVLVRMKGNDARGFLRIHAGQREFTSKGKLRSDSLPLAMVLRIQHMGHRAPQAFATLHPTPQEFYIREPLDAELRLGQAHHFHVQSLLDTRHHKLSMRAPSTKEHNFIYFPADGCYLLDLECRETGPWNLGKQQGQEVLDQVTAEAFHKVAAYLRGEMLASAEDYQLIETLASLGQQRLRGLKPTLEQLEGDTERLGDMDREMQGCLEYVDELERRVDALVSLSSEVDKYAGLIEEKVKDYSMAQASRSPTTRTPKSP